MTQGKADHTAHEWFDSIEQRVVVLAKPVGHLLACCLALTLQCKNLRNTIHYVVRNVLTAYTWDVSSECWRRRSELHAAQQAAIDCFSQVIKDLNAAREAKYLAIKDAGGEKADKAKLTIIPELGLTVQNVYRTVIDLTVLDNVAKLWPDQHGNVVYRRLPAKAAQLVVARYKDGWSGYFEVKKVYEAKGPGAAAMTGAPKPPNYLAKRDHFVLELPLTQIGPTLIGLGDRKIPVNFEESLSLTAEQMEAWNAYRVGEQVERACAKRGIPASAAQHLRMVPKGKSVKFEVVVRMKSRIPSTSLLAKMKQSLGKVMDGSASKRNEALRGAVASVDVPAAGGDRGLNNTLTLAFTTGHNAEVISGGRLDEVLGRLDEALDNLKSKLTTPEVRALQQRKEDLALAGSSLTRRERIELMQGLKAIYANLEYRELRGARERWLNDYFHKLSRGVVNLCAKRGVQVIALGQNKGWKVESNMGVTQNRRLGRAPLTRLIEMIRYKAEALGMVVVTTEESYTSKTSFVSNEPLRSFEEEKPKRERNQKNVEAASQPLSAQAGTPKAQPTALGRRLKDKERNTFVNNQETGRLARVHADVNGAFNVLRKVFKGFAYHRKLSLNYRLSRVSPRLGLTAIRLTGGGRSSDLGTAGSSNRRSPRDFILSARAAEL
ncbi:transposase [Cupriavidus basilensis]|uniref:transposase n=2 Tax=Cupriavidus TaxID=106589 RepID=UPI0023E8CC96|nr:transposase [Cupriavidus basilensis]MDF3887172.1 transposase [Cupriavidus basilensis]